MRTVLGLVSNIALATRIAKAARTCHLGVCNFDRAEKLVAKAVEQKPLLILLDWDGCEAEAFKVLNEQSQNADLKTVPAIGMVSASKRALKEEAQRAGCDRVYWKSEFQRDLESILARYAQ